MVFCCLRGKNRGFLEVDQGTTCEVFLKGDEKSDIIVFCCTEFQQEYFSEKDFREKANIHGKCLKDIWDEVQNPRFM